MDRTFNGNMVKKITGKEFKDSGGLWFVNTMLHMFGMAITWNSDTDELKANICKFRGFDEKSNDDGFKQITKYMKDNAKELLKDCE